MEMRETNERSYEKEGNIDKDTSFNEMLEKASTVNET